MHASHVVVDGHDGYTFWRGSDGELFTFDTASAFAEQRNAEMKPEHRLYGIYMLVQGRHEYPRPVPDPYAAGPCKLADEMNEPTYSPGIDDYPPTCILTGEPGENPDDCTTHEHE